MNSLQVRRWMKLSNRLVFWGFGLYLVVLALSLWMIFTRPAWIFWACGVAIAVSLLFAAIAAVASILPQRLLILLTTHRYLVCPKDLQPLDELPHEGGGICPRCGTQYSLEELQWEWAATMMDSAKS